MTQTTTITRANELRNLNIPSVIIDKNKRAIVEWKQFQSRLPTTAETNSMFARPHHGLAAITGKFSGIEVLDFDLKYDATGNLWQEFVEIINQTAPDLYEKLVVSATVNKGYHLIYRLEADLIGGNKPLARRPATEAEREAGDKIKVKIETRGQGGYFALPPTPGYQFIQGDHSAIPTITKDDRDLLFSICRSFDEMPVQSEPAEQRQAASQNGNGLSAFDDYNQRGDVVDLLKRHGWKERFRSGERIFFLRPGETESKTSANYHTGRRVFFVHSTSTEFETKGYNPVGVYAMLEHNSDYSAASRALYAAGYGERHQNSKGQQQSKAQSEPTAEDVKAWETEQPEPLPAELLPVPKFSTQLMPRALRNFCEDTAERMQCPIEFPACALIVSAAAVIGSVVRIQPKRFDSGWLVTPNLWGNIVAPPGKLKTPALEAGLVPIKKREQIARQANAEERRQFEFEKASREAKKEALKGKMKEAAKKGKPLEQFQNDFEMLHSELDEPFAPNYVVNDATVEKLGVLLNRNPNGFLMFRDELVGLWRNLDKPENSEARAFLLSCWNGYGSYVFDRITRGETRIENLTLSILGGVQPSVLAPYLRNSIGGGQFDDGFIQRFQLAFYPDFGKWQLVDRQPDKEAAQLAHECFARLDNLTEGEPNAVLLFDDEAQIFFYEWLENLERDLESGEFEHPALIAHFSKYRSLMPSLALIFYLFDLAEQNKEISSQSAVSLEATARAAAWCELLAAHARRIYGIAITQETTQAKTILQKIRAGKINAMFKARDIYRNQWTGLQTDEECQKPLQLLVDYGYLRTLSVTTTDRGGRPTLQYVVHPSLLEGEVAE